MLIIGIWLIAVMLILNFFAGATERNKENIILRPLDMEKSQLNETLIAELDKCTEEDNEFKKGALSNDIDNTIEEFWDSVQTKLNVMGMMGIPTDLIYRDLDKHIKKMNNRGYVFKEWFGTNVIEVIEISFVVIIVGVILGLVISKIETKLQWKQLLILKYEVLILAPILRFIYKRIVNMKKRLGALYKIRNKVQDKFYK